jgi:hypothetical protein
MNKRILLIPLLLFVFALLRGQVATVTVGGVEWATCNVNTPNSFTAKPSDAGLYYQWNRRVGWSRAPFSFFHAAARRHVERSETSHNS